MSAQMIVAGLTTLGVPASLRDAFAAPLERACARFAIATPARIAGFLSQCHVESAGFTRLSENLNYTTPARLTAVWSGRFPAGVAASYVGRPQAIANRAYAGRLGNGDEASGDGWRYRGRGLKQLTGRDNYAAASRALALDYLSAPDLLLTPTHAALTAAWFWSANGCNALADRRAWHAVTRTVNGPAMLQADTRAARAESILKRLEA